ncbi:MAG: two-component system sensor histidine kinase NtrB [Candidatus Zixiibacteriota bacterium]
MVQDTRKDIKLDNPLETYHYATEKPILALDALSKLIRQFTQKPDFKSLMEMVLLTLNGQFSVVNSFIIVRSPGAGSNHRLYLATGKFNHHEQLRAMSETKDFFDHFQGGCEAFFVEEMKNCEACGAFAELFDEFGVKMIAPFSHEQDVIGVVGLGEKVNKTAFEPMEYNLFATLVQTLSPLIVNSILFVEIANLNSWYLEILDSVKQGVFVFDRDYKLKKINLSGLKILEKFVPKLVESVSLVKMPIHYVFPDTVFPSWARRMVSDREGNYDYLLENMVVQQDDEKGIFNVRLGKLIHDSSYEYDLVITVDDITAQKENERRLFELEKFADKGMLASSIAHELNNFLALILGGVELTQIALRKGNLEKAGSTLEKLKSNIAKMKRFTAGLMDYSKLNTSKEIADLNEVVKDVLSFVAVQKKFTQVSLHTEFDDRIPKFAMDKDQIAQLLLNFLNNAVDAIFEVGHKNGQIWVRTVYRDDNTATISIADNGAGIKPEVKERLFKVHLTTKEKGHGYGLVTCARIIENHHALIDIESEVGSGTMFTVQFPLHEDIAGNAPSPEKP